MRASPSCACCGGWAEHLRSGSLSVHRVDEADMTVVKDRLGVPADERSCHTAEVAGYFVEGHVPAAALLRLMAERPAIDGVTLAGMPPGSPGMGGEAVAPLVVNAVADGVVIGEFGRY